MTSQTFLKEWGLLTNTNIIFKWVITMLYALYSVFTSRCIMF